MATKILEARNVSVEVFANPNGIDVKTFTIIAEPELFEWLGKTVEATDPKSGTVTLRIENWKFIRERVQ